MGTEPAQNPILEEAPVVEAPSLTEAALAVAAALLYLTAGARQLLSLDPGAQKPRRGVLLLASAAVSTHLVLALITLGEGSLNLGVYKVASLIFLTMGIISLAMLMARPVHIMIIATFPLAALSVLLYVFAPATGSDLSKLPDGLILHITLALVAFGVLTLATLQAALVSIQTSRLRQHKTRGILRMLPPLDLMEALFYELLTAGTFLLTIAVLTGAIYIDDLLGQQLVHKTVLTGLAYLIFSVTLFVHWSRGWRIGTALGLMFTGFVCLAIGFFGSKLVLELIL